MGELAALASIYEGMLLSHETSAPIKDGVLWPSVITLSFASAGDVNVAIRASPPRREAVLPSEEP